jgi:hypothetical protein
MRSSVCFGGEQLDTGRMMMRRPQQAERGAAISLDVCARGALSVVVFALCGRAAPHATGEAPIHYCASTSG